MHKCAILMQLDKYTIRISGAEPDILELEPNEPGLPEFQIRAKDVQSMEFVRQAWLKDISEMKERDGMFFFNNYKKIFKFILFQKFTEQFHIQFLFIKRAK